MQVDQIKQVASRNPFRPFTIRLSNGTTYDFKEPRNFGAPRDMHTVFYFGENEWVLIDPVHIVELVDRTA
jgi:hypothetical protein